MNYQFVNFDELRLLFDDIPAPSPEEIRRSYESHAGDIWQVTVCPSCGTKYFGWRLGCSAKECQGFSDGNHAWCWEATSGSLYGSDCQTAIIEHGVDFRFIDDHPGEAAKE